MHFPFLVDASTVTFELGETGSTASTTCAPVSVFCALKGKCRLTGKFETALLITYIPPSATTATNATMRTECDEDMILHEQKHVLFNCFFWRSLNNSIISRTEATNDLVSNFS